MVNLLPRAFAAAVVAFGVTATAVVAFQARPTSSRFDALVIDDPTRSLDVATTPAASLPRAEGLRAGWEGFRAKHGSSFAVHLDRRSGAPLLVEGRGIPWTIAKDATVDSIASSLRAFVASHRALLLADDAELVVDRDASGQASPQLWQIVFRHVVAGVPVVGERYVFHIGHGNLISFGASRWSRIDTSPFPDIDASDAVERAYAYMGLSATDRVKRVDKGSLQLIPLRSGGSLAPAAGPYAGAVGSGYTSALVWRVALRIDGEPGTWEAQIDAHTGAIRSFTDVNDYAQVQGGVYPVSNDQVPEGGIEQPAWPMPYANVTVGAVSQTAGALGLFDCSTAGSTATTTLAGPYIRVADACGPIAQSVTCDDDLDLSFGPGTDCEVPAGASAGDTHASRTGFYHLNRIAEHGRAWLPSRTWLSEQLTDNVNLNGTCNAFWDGESVNFLRSGDGCNNTGEIAGIFLHEWGHGLDDNDGGGEDNPTEAYADITSFMSTHLSCIGRGFRPGTPCSGYGDVCLNCTGIRDVDYAMRLGGTPATPQGFVTSRCGVGSGPCGREIHCEGYVGAETLWDLANRDLPLSGLDQATSWQLADKLWYTSRLGSGGNAYNCALPSSDGCAATSWFTKLRVQDDDDGNLANGTPHAAAIFAAFNRHKIACGVAGDASNQSTGTCPALSAPTLTVLAGSASAQLNWTAVPGAAGYHVLRNDASCSAGSTIVATVAGTSFTDLGLADGFPEYYRVQAVSTNPACDGPLSSCQFATPQPFAGTVRLDASTYACSGVVHVTVSDANVPASTTTVEVTSATEPAGPTITLTRIAPGSSIYAGTLQTTGDQPSADGRISVVAGDTISATYVDADDGQGGVNLTRTTTASIDCTVPTITNVASGNATGTSARITWTTNEPASSAVHYGPLAPPGATTGTPTRGVAHAVDLTGLAECTSYVYAVASSDAVGNLAIDDRGGAYYTFATVRDTTASYASTDGPVAIPDNAPGGASSSITVTDNKVVQNVAVTLNLTHTFDGDLVISLVPPAGAPITLSNRRGADGQNFTSTVFDDAAATAISVGTAPFTGSFRPDSPLAATNGIVAAGVWQLRVVDAAGFDVGTIDGWTLTLAFPAQPCGPHASFQSHAAMTDQCPAGGAGDANARWDAGERVTFAIVLKNDGAATLSHVGATVTSTTPGVVMLHGTAGFPDVAPGAVADSLAPHVTAYLPPGLACGQNVLFSVAIASDQGSWSGGSFGHAVGLIVPGGGSAINETFANGIPAAWSVVNGGSGGDAAATWTTANPGGRTFAAPLVAPVAIVDSDRAGSDSTTTQDEQLVTPVMNLQAAIAVTLQFDQSFHYYNGNLGEIGDVDVLSAATHGLWANVMRQESADSPNPDHRTVDLTLVAAGQTDVRVRFHYYNAHYEWWWQVDNVKVDMVTPATCSQTVCAGSTGGARPVADGSYGTAMRGSRSDAAGTTIALTWDVTTCSSADHRVLYGNLANVATATVAGARCDLGTSGSASWSGVPPGNLWFVVVGDNDGTTEGSWGETTAGERGGTAPSGLCGATTRDNAASCP